MKSDFVKVWKKDQLMNITKFTQVIFDICCQEKNMADCHDLEGKLEPVLSLRPFHLEFGPLGRDIYSVCILVMTTLHILMQFDVIDSL